MANSRIVANQFLTLAAQQGRALTQMQVLKLVYIAHGWNLALLGRPLIDERVEAWQYGPVIRELYNGMRQFGGRAVTGLLPLTPGDRAEDLDPQQVHLVNEVYRLYGHMNGIKLSQITHARNTPWEQTYSPGAFGTEIPMDLITDHYQRLHNERISSTTA